VSGRVYNIACGHRTSLLELIAVMNDLLGTEISPIHEPARPGDVRHSQADISRAVGELGYWPQTSVAVGVRSCLAFLRAESVTTDMLAPAGEHLA
jgi:nucleoside-diphosphate-sugar epimerase